MALQVPLLFGLLIFEWYVVWCGSRQRSRLKSSYELKRMKIFTFFSCSFYIWTLTTYYMWVDPNELETFVPPLMLGVVRSLSPTHSNISHLYVETNWNMKIQEENPLHLNKMWEGATITSWSSQVGAASENIVFFFPFFTKVGWQDGRGSLIKMEANVYIYTWFELLNLESYAYSSGGQSLSTGWRVSLTMIECQLWNMFGHMCCPHY